MSVDQDELRELYNWLADTCALGDGMESDVPLSERKIRVLLAVLSVTLGGDLLAAEVVERSQTWIDGHPDGHYEKPWT